MSAARSRLIVHIAFGDRFDALMPRLSKLTLRYSSANSNAIVLIGADCGERASRFEDGFGIQYF
jgi:hypothetical protein